MLVINRLGVDAARYYLEGPVSGEWTGRGSGALGLAGPVGPEALNAVLHGVDPATGTRLQGRYVPNRRAGWDLIFAAPKSVSLLAGLAPPPTAAALRGAHRAATDETLAWIEQHACWARRRGGVVAGEGVVAARYDHTQSAAGDPHVHAHLLLANLTSAGDGRWSALDTSALWVQRRAIAATYHLALRHHLAGLGLGGWRLAPDGTFDLVDVPRAAITASSRRGAEVAAVLDGGEGRSGAARRAARDRTRSPATDGWWAAVTEVGFGAGAAAGVLRSGHDRAAMPDRTEALAAATPAPTPVGADAVSEWLLARRSTFTTVDVLSALAATVPHGLPAEAAQEWAERFCERSLRAEDGRRTTAQADRADRGLAARATGGQRRGLGTTPGDAAARALAVRPGLQEALEEPLHHLVTSGDAVELLGVGVNPTPGARHEPLVAQAALLDAARAAWQGAGHTVAILCPPEAAARWHALAALEPAHRSAGQPTVVIVDRADRLSTIQLATVLDRAERIPAKVVLVRGGTLPPRWRALSEGLERLPPVVPAALPVTTGSAGPSVEAGSLTVSSGTHQAFDRVVAEWIGRGGAGAVMVGLGPAEVAELNTRARRALRDGGELRGPDVLVGGRAFAVGERVIPLSRAAGRVGAEGRVLAVDAAAKRVTVAWDGRRAVLDHWSARRLGHAYAVTPAGLTWRAGPVLLLGEPAALGRHAARVERAALLAPAVAELGQPGELRDAVRFRRAAAARLVEARRALDPGRGRARPLTRDGLGVGR